MSPLECAVCLRIGDRGVPAITVANGHALCGRHFQRLNIWETEQAGTPSLLRIVSVMYAPDPIPANPPFSGGAA